MFLESKHRRITCDIAQLSPSISMLDQPPEGVIVQETIRLTENRESVELEAWEQFEGPYESVIDVVISIRRREH